MQCNVYQTDHPLSKFVCGAFAEGSGGKLRSPDKFHGGISVVYGILRGCGDIIKKAESEGLPWIHIDHGYFARGTYYRVTPNWFQDTEIYDCDDSRFQWHLNRWQLPGDVVYVVPPAPLHAEFRGIEDWKHGIEGPVTIADKHCKLENAKELIVFNSLLAVGAVMRGIPAYMLDKGCLKKEPVCWDRLPWAHSLSWSQWTLEEMRHGECYERCLHRLRSERSRSLPSVSAIPDTKNLNPAGYSRAEA